MLDEIVTKFKKEQKLSKTQIKKIHAIVLLIRDYFKFPEKEDTIIHIDGPMVVKEDQFKFHLVYSSIDPSQNINYVSCDLDGIYTEEEVVLHLDKLIGKILSMKEIGSTISIHCSKESMGKQFIKISSKLIKKAYS